MLLNDYYQNVGMKGYFNRYGFINAIRRGSFIANPFHIVKDYEIKKFLWQEKALKKVSKYLKYKDTIPEGFRYGNYEVDNPVWIYWNSGIEKAPEIVKCCYESILKKTEQTVILLTEKNLSEYLVFPNYITEKMEAGKIPIAGYTDLMRFALLEHFGGTWIDATIYLTGPIPEQILNCDFFAFRNALGLLDNPVLFPAWFTHASKGNKTITEVRNVVCAYWMKEQHVIEYLLPNLIMTAIIKEDKEAERNIPYLDSEYSERLIRIIDEKYTKEKADWIKKLTPIHKLTYKLDNSINQEGNIYRSIIERKF